MASSARSLPGSPVTPLEPCRRSAPAETADATAVRHAIHATAFRRIEAAVASSCGSQHAANEDAHSGLDGAGGLYVVADGVGGGALAATASRLLVTHLHAALEGRRLDADRVRDAVLDADRLIAQTIAQSTHLPGAATVVACAPVDRTGSGWMVAWVGDCRAYRLALDADAIERLTVDDTFGNLGEVPPDGGSPDDPARMVGNGATSGANVAMHSAAVGDILVLCSDGVHKHVDTDAWSRVLRRPVPLLQRCEDLVALARRNGSIDDATVLLLERHGIAAIERPSWLPRFGTPRREGA